MKESYCGALKRYKEELSKPIDEASTFLSNMESELNNLCNESPTVTAAAGGTADRNYNHSGKNIRLHRTIFISLERNTKTAPNGQLNLHIYPPSLKNTVYG